MRVVHVPYNWSVLAEYISIGYVQRVRVYMYGWVVGGLALVGELVLVCMGWMKLINYCLELVRTN